MKLNKKYFLTLLSLLGLIVFGIGPSLAAMDSKDWADLFEIADTVLNDKTNTKSSSKPNNNGYLHALGNDMPRNYEKAMYWYLKASEQNSAQAQFSIGQMYEYAHGVEKNKAEAKKWYQKAALQGHETAKYSLETIN